MRAWRSSRARGESGLGLVELVVATALLGAVVAVLGPVMTGAMGSGRVVGNESQAIDGLRTALARIDGELRSAECISMPVTGAQGSTLQFVTDAGSQGAYQVTYAVTNGQLTRTVGQVTTVLGDGIVTTGREFTQAATAGNRHTVGIALQVRFEKGHAPRLVQTTIAGRNAWSAC